MGLLWTAQNHINLLTMLGMPNSHHQKKWSVNTEVISLKKKGITYLLQRMKGHNESKREVGWTPETIRNQICSLQEGISQGGSGTPSPDCWEWVGCQKGSVTFQQQTGQRRALQFSHVRWKKNLLCSKRTAVLQKNCSVHCSVQHDLQR